MRRENLAVMALVLVLAGAMFATVLYLPSSDVHTPGPGNGTGVCLGTAECFEGEVERIVDGDTLYVEGVKIRLSLVDTPESGEAGFWEAKDFVEYLCPEGSQATVDQDDWQLEDNYGRMLAVVHCNGKNLNEELLDGGYGEILTYYCDLSEFGGETWARRHGC